MNRRKRKRRRFLALGTLGLAGLGLLLASFLIGISCRRVERPDAVSGKPTPEAQTPEVTTTPNRQISPDLDGPANSIDALMAAKYCRWLSAQEGIPEDQMCYPSLDEIGPQMSMLSPTNACADQPASWYSNVCTPSKTTSVWGMAMPAPAPM